MAQGDVPSSPGGPFRRRREKRQLEHLVHESSQHEVSPIAARAHIKVLDEQAAEGDQKPEGEASEAPGQPHDERPPGFHVRAVPIDEPLDD